MTGGLMSFLGVGPQIGGGFLPDDGKPGRDHLVLLSQLLAGSLWRRSRSGWPHHLVEQRKLHDRWSGSGQALNFQTKG